MRISCNANLLAPTILAAPLMKQLWTPWRITYLSQGSASGGSECVFCSKLQSGDARANHLLYRGSECFVTLNLYPYNNGHLMVVPNRHVSSIEDLSETEITELMVVTQQSIRVLKEAYNPQGFNVGINQGAAAGAGITGHLHQHVVPRWGGDTNYMTVIGDTRTIPEWIDQTYERLSAIWDSQFPSNKEV